MQGSRIPHFVPGFGDASPSASATRRPVVGQPHPTRSRQARYCPDEPHTRIVGQSARRPCRSVSCYGLQRVREPVQALIVEGVGSRPADVHAARRVYGEVVASVRLRHSSRADHRGSVRLHGEAAEHQGRARGKLRKRRGRGGLRLELVDAAGEKRRPPSGLHRGDHSSVGVRDLVAPSQVPRAVLIPQRPAGRTSSRRKATAVNLPGRVLGANNSPRSASSSGRSASSSKTLASGSPGQADRAPLLAAGSPCA
jgi:hypothetical protein